MDETMYANDFLSLDEQMVRHPFHDLAKAQNLTGEKAMEALEKAYYRIERIEEL